jgi:hypothetical protein
VELRQHAETLDLQQPLAGVATTLASWQGCDAPPALPAPAEPTAEPIAPPARSRRKGGSRGGASKPERLSGLPSSPYRPHLCRGDPQVLPGLGFPIAREKAETQSLRLADRATRQDQTQDGERLYQELSAIRVADRRALAQRLESASSSTLVPHVGALDERREFTAGHLQFLLVREVDPFAGSASTKCSTSWGQRGSASRSASPARTPGTSPERGRRAGQRRRRPAHCRKQRSSVAAQASPG